MTAPHSHHLQTLGGLQFGPHREVKPLLLLVYLVLNGPARRADLGALLWPRAAEPGNNLRVALSKLRRWGVHVTCDGEWCAASVPCDARRPHAARPGRPFLLGVKFGEISDELETWLYDQRERLARDAQRHLLTAAARAPHGRERLLRRAWTLPGAPPPDAAFLAGVLDLCADGSDLLTRASAELSDLAPDWPVQDVPRAVRAALAWWLGGGAPREVPPGATLTGVTAVLRGSGLPVVELHTATTAELDRAVRWALASCGAGCGHAALTLVLRHDGPRAGLRGVLGNLIAHDPDLRIILTARTPPAPCATPGAARSPAGPARARTAPPGGTSPLPGQVAPHRPDWPAVTARGAPPSAPPTRPRRAPFPARPLPTRRTPR